MATLTLKNLPPELHHRLRARAARNRRSLNSEVIECLRLATMSTQLEPETLLARARALRSKVSGRLSQRQVRELRRRGRP